MGPSPQVVLQMNQNRVFLCRKEYWQYKLLKSLEKLQTPKSNHYLSQNLNFWFIVTFLFALIFWFYPLEVIFLSYDNKQPNQRAFYWKY